jgi:hypothetical protein
MNRKKVEEEGPGRYVVTFIDYLSQILDVVIIMFYVQSTTRSPTHVCMHACVYFAQTCLYDASTKQIVIPRLKLLPL